MIIALLTPSFAGFSDFYNAKKAQAENVGEELLNEKDKLALSGGIAEPGEKNKSAMVTFTGERLSQMQAILTKTSISGVIEFPPEWQGVFADADFNGAATSYFDSYWNYANKTQKLIITQKDLEAIRQNKVDRRVKAFIIYLVTPKDRGGAGHELIQISQIVASDSDVNKSTEPSILSHAYPDSGFSQAVDVATVDYLRCSVKVVKKNWVGTTKTETTAMNPSAIKISWQGGKFGSSEETLGISINALANSLTNVSFLELLDQLGISQDEYSSDEFSSTINLSNVATFIGRGIFEQVIQSPSHSWQGTNFDDIMDNLGRAIIADQLGVPRQTIQGNDTNELETSIGQYYIEQSLGLPTGSLSGKNNLEILRNAGARKIEKELNLPIRTFDYDKITSAASLNERIAQRLLEGNLYLEENSLATNDFDKFMTAMGKERADWIRANPYLADERFGVKTDTTANFLNNHNVAWLKEQITNELKASTIEQYKNYPWNVAAGTKNPSDSATTEEGGVPQGNKRDEALDIPEGSIDPLLAGDRSKLETIGAYEISKVLSTADDQREILYHWLLQYKDTMTKDLVFINKIEPIESISMYSNDPFHLPQFDIKTNPDFKLSEAFKKTSIDENEFTSKFYTVESGDINKIFLFGNTSDVFKQEGQHYLFEGLKNSTVGQKLQTKLNDSSSVQKLIKINNDINFYTTRVNDIRSRTENIEKNINSIDSSKTVLKDYVKNIRQEFDLLSKHMAINQVSPTVGRITENWQKFQAELDKPENESIKNQTKEDVKVINKDIKEIVKGEEIEENYDAIDSDPSTQSTPDNSTTLITKKDLIYLAKNPKEIKNFAKTIAARKTEQSLKMPTNSLQYFMAATTKSQDTLKQSVGQAAIEEKLDLPAGSFVSTASYQDKSMGLLMKLESAFVATRPTGETDQETEKRVSEIFNMPYELTAGKPPLLWNLIQLSEDLFWEDYASNLNEIDDKLSIEHGTTQKMLSGKITVTEYCQKVGAYQLGFKISDSLYDSNVNFMGQKLTTEDLYNILIGRSLDPFAKIGGKRIEDKFGLPEDYGYKLVTAKSNDERKYLLAEIGGIKLSNLLGVDRPINLSSLNPSDLVNSVGNAHLEGTIGLISDSFSDNLDETISKNTYAFITGFGLPNILKNKIDIDWDQLRIDIVDQNLNSPTYKKFQQAINDKTQIVTWVKEAIAPMTKITDPDTYYTDNYLYLPLDKLRAQHYSEKLMNEARNFQYRLAEIDRNLSLVTGTTAKMLKGEITPKEYRSKTSKQVFTNLAATKLDQLLNLENKYNISLADPDHGLVATYNNLTSSDPAKQRIGTAQLYDNFSAAFSIDLDQTASFTPGTIKSIILNPAEAKNIMLNQGFIKIDSLLGLGPDCEKDDSCSDLSKYGFNGFTQKLFNAYQTQYDITCENPVDPSSCRKQATTATGRAAMGIIESGVELKVIEKIGSSSGILIPQEDAHRLIRGDYKIFAYVKFAEYAGNQLSAGIPNLPDDYKFTYNDFKYAIEGNAETESEIRKRAQALGAKEYEKLYPPTTILPPGTTSSLSDRIIINDPEATASKIYGYSQSVGTGDGQAYFPPPNDATLTLSALKGDGADLNSDISYYQTLPPDTLDINSSVIAEENLRQQALLGGIPASDVDAITADRATYATNQLEYATEIGDEAVLKQKKYWKTEPFYKLSDSMLWKNNPNIPHGFTRSMIEGNTVDRMMAMGGVIELTLKENNPDNKLIQALATGGTLPTLINYFSTSPDKRDFNAIKNSAICDTIDNYLNVEVFGNKGFPPPGFTLSLFAASQNHWNTDTRDVNGTDIGQSFQDVMKDYVWSSLMSKVDEWLKLDIGTAYQVYTMYKAYDAAHKAYIAAKAANDTKAQADASSDMKQVEGAVVSFVVQTIFKKQFAELDEKWGLMPGSTSGIAGSLIGWAFGTNPLIGLAIVLVINLFGMRIKSVDYRCSACGYYPNMGKDYTIAAGITKDAANFFRKKFNSNKIGKKPMLDNADESCTLPDFDPTNDVSYQDGLKAAATYKSKQIMQDALGIQDITGDEYLRPTQVIMYNFTSVEEEAERITDLYGSISERGYSGVWANDLLVDHVHVGY